MADEDVKLPSILSPEIRKKIISADEARQLMVKSVRGLDGKLAEISRLIQDSARKGETKAEVYSLQTGRSTAPIYERMDNLGRVLMEVLRYAGYEAKLKEFRTSDSCMLYIMADWSEMRAAPQEAKKPRKPGESPDAAQHPEAPRRRQPGARTGAPAAARSAGSGEAANQGGASQDIAGNDKASQQGDAKQDPANEASADANSEQADNAEGTEADDVKTKKFDPSKLVTETDKGGIPLADIGSLKGGNLGKEIYGYSKETSGERVPIILPVVMPI